MKVQRDSRWVSRAHVHVLFVCVYVFPTNVDFQHVAAFHSRLELYARLPKLRSIPSIAQTMLCAHDPKPHLVIQSR